MRHFLISSLVSAFVLVAQASNAADILDEIPSGSLGFVVIHNLASVDTKVGQLATLLQRNLPKPLSFLKAVTGISDGLNADGDLMIALFPTSSAAEERLRFCVWLPVADYDRFIDSIGATLIDGIAVASIAGEDLLVARRGDWALIMDPDDRSYLAQLAAAAPSSSPVAAWRPWINSNDTTFVAFTPGVHQVLDWVLASREDGPAPTPADDDVFGGRNPRTNRRAIIAASAIRTPADLLENVKLETRKWFSAIPALRDAMEQASILGFGVRIDANNNALASTRIAFPQELTAPLLLGAAEKSIEFPYNLYTGGGFVLNGSGRLPAPIASALTTAYLIRTSMELNETEGKTGLDDETMNKMQGAATQAAAEVRAVVVLSQPGDQLEPVYSNDFLTLRVASATSFITHANEVMRLWNKANRAGKSDTQIVFDIEETKVGERSATVYSLDMTALAGGAILPEVRQMMEKMFGPGGKLRFWIIQADDNTVVLATATPDQVTKALAAYDRKQPIEWRGDQLSEASALLPADADWKVFVDLHRYANWSRREAGAVAGVPVIGGPLVRDFPASPPIGLAGGFRAGEFWLDAAVPALTLKGTDSFLSRNRSRVPAALRGRFIPAAPRPLPAPAPKE